MPIRSPSPAPEARHWLSPVCAWLALSVPLLVTLLRAATSTQWRDDLPVVRGLGFVPVGGEGTLSSTLMQASSLLPLGGRLLRASMVSALGLAVAAWLVYQLALRTLEVNAATRRLGPILSLAAALNAALCPTWQLEGTIAGSTTVALALALGGLLLRPSSEVNDARHWLGFGALSGAALLESHAAGLALAVALAAQVIVRGEAPTRRKLSFLLAGTLAISAICLIPLALRPFAEHASANLGYNLSTSGVTAADHLAERPSALEVWLRDVGIVSLGLAAGGALSGLLRKRTRLTVAPLVALVFIDLMLPASRAGLLSQDPLIAIRLLALAALGILAALCVQSIGLGLERARVPMARAALALIVVFDFTLVLVTGEDSAYLADRRSQHAAEVWTDEALSDLPPHSVLLVRSQAVAWRLWAASIVRGERPDVIVVPLPLLERGSVASRLLELEPALAPLMREVAVNGRPNELALSTLSDLRPLHVELDPNWDPRLLQHLVPRPLWLGFSPHALGRSDRTDGLQRSRSSFQRVLAYAKRPEYRDAATLTLLAARTGEQAVLMASLGDRLSVEPLLADLRSIDDRDPLVLDIQKRLDRQQRGRIDVAGLLP